MAIGALPALSDGNEARSLTQQWARAIYEDQPAGPETTGIAGRRLRPAPHPPHPRPRVDFSFVWPAKRLFGG